MAASSNARREANRTDETAYSFTDSTKEDAPTGLELQRRLEIERQSALTALRSLMRSNTVLSTTSTIATDQQKAKEALERGELQRFEELGKGSCGRIFDKPGEGRIIKVQIVDFNVRTKDTWILWRDYCVHERVHQAFKDATNPKVKVSVPKAYNHHRPDDEVWWSQNGFRFPPGSGVKRTAVIEAERIVGVSKSVRENLISLFSKPDEIYKNYARSSLGYKHCLIFPLLGSHRGSSKDGNHMRPISQVLNLANFKLHVDMMESLDVGITDLCLIYAHALVILHYTVGVSATDVEFVWGSKPTRLVNPSLAHSTIPDYDQPPPMRFRMEPTDTNFHKRSMHIWLIDFNMCENLCKDNPVRMAVKGIVDNAHAFFPRPRFSHQEYGPAAMEADNKNWQTFKNEYIRLAKSVPNPVTKMIPERFIQAMEQHYRNPRPRK